MTLAEAVRTCFRKYITFSGRASRSEYWKFVLFLILGLIVLTVVNAVLFGPGITQEIQVKVSASGEQTQRLVTKKMYNAGWLGFVFQLATLLPLLAVAWRRMHDTGRPGWHVGLPIPVFICAFLLIYATSEAIPIDRTKLPEHINSPSTVPVPGNPLVFLFSWAICAVSMIWVVVWLSRKSQDGPNRFDHEPLAAGTET